MLTQSNVTFLKIRFFMEASITKRAIRPIHPQYDGANRTFRRSQITPPTENPNNGSKIHALNRISFALHLIGTYSLILISQYEARLDSSTSLDRCRHIFNRISFQFHIIWTYSLIFIHQYAARLKYSTSFNSCLHTFWRISFQFHLVWTHSRILLPQYAARLKSSTSLSRCIYTFAGISFIFHTISTHSLIFIPLTPRGNGIRFLSFVE